MTLPRARESGRHRPVGPAARHGPLFVYGTQDPAVAERFRPGGPDSRVLWVPGGNHGADLADLSPADRTAAEDTPARWAGQEYFTHTLGT
ncbi:hypothetical protein [Streptomyces sp. NPDC088801]|uniref:hypothetical protein n=1 Tax=Streptomyces sp. NPDC088801 TaxID=3365903 RepID=UPI0037F76369